MKTSIATVSIAGDLGEKLTAIAAAGFDGIEIFEQDFITFDGSPADVGEMVRGHGMTIDLFQPLRDFEGLPEPLRARAFDRVERKFDLMQELGCELLLVSSTTHDKALGGIDRMAADFRELGERAAKRGLRVGYEARAWGTHVKDYRDAWEVVRRAGHPSVGLILDSFHTLAIGSDLSAMRSIPGDRIFHVQLADAPLIEMNLEYWSRHFRTMPGEGDLALVDFMAAVAATGYAGPLSLEILNDQFRAGSPRVIAVDGKRSLLSLMDKVRGVTPDLNAALAPPAMPSRVKVNGVEFVEFTASEEEAETLGAMLSTLGFSKVSRHVAKDIDLWRQGDINLVVNTEREGFAHSAYIMHGTSVCDIGLHVADAAAAVERARVLGANLFSQKRGKDELDIPAVRGVGGSVLHFLDRHSELAGVWDKEFTKVEQGATGPGAGLTRIDHIAQVMNFEEMQTWTLFYDAIFDVERTPLVDVVDPNGLVHSRAVQTPDGVFRLTLNGADTHRTLAGRFIADSYGSSVQHLAFATDDLLDTAGKLADLGFKALPISENYYADLVTRFDIDAALLARLKAANILYDEDENGAFFQLYSRPYGEGFFFEIIERRNGYDGFGKPNAPFRTAAQKRLARPAGMPRR
ncbi:bifunctional sugar phosphate isomerase/epimerase/4-hydroxyphenylpyruvate dioxygenase family protein [Celeribacter sp.]|uniref:bifunctional sugar phosphate isomerase/epimerase/4-hydroxyphenylpyruvate dioxygenase family protein n=1 Tax=Celeribacter sp. TaxID=1890673 RepID=UPI003A941E2E